MAKEWYLLGSPHNQLSGYESDAFDDFAEEGFQEALESSIGIDVELCNADLSIMKKIRAIIQKNVQDTKLQAFTRHLLVSIGTCKAGWYIKYKNRFWLITGLVDDNGMYEKAVLSLCNWKMTWLNNNGDLIERWCYVQSASQYNNGKTAHRFYTLRSDQLLVCMPSDDECLLLDSGKRFVIDKRTQIYEKNISDDVKSDTTHKLITYELTRSDSVLYNYSDSGHYEMLVTQDEQHTNDGYYLINNKGYWICFETGDILENQSDDTTLPPDSKESKSEILYSSNKIYLGLGAAEFTAVFYEGNEIVDTSPEWGIDCDFSDLLQVDYINNTICISVDDFTLLNKSFELFLYNDQTTRIKVDIVGLI